MLVSCIICFKGIWEFHALKDLHEGALHTDRRSFGFPLMCGTYSNKDFFLPFSPARLDLRAGLGTSPPSRSPPLFRHWKLCAAFNVTELWCQLEEFARTDWLILGSAVKWPCLKLFHWRIHHGEPSVGKRLTPDTKRKCWSEERERSLFTDYSRVT